MTESWLRDHIVKCKVTRSKSDAETAVFHTAMLGRWEIVHQTPERVVFKQYTDKRKLLTVTWTPEGRVDWWELKIWTKEEPVVLRLATGTYDGPEKLYEVLMNEDPK